MKDYTEDVQETVLNDNEDMTNVDEKLLELVTEKSKSEDKKLPSEEQMVNFLGISRTALRERLRIYEANGFIVARQGSGRYVQLPSISAQITSGWAVMLKINPSLLLDLLDIRCLLEVNTLPNVIERITNSQLQQLAKIVERMKQLANEGKSFVEEDRSFHETLFSSTGNEFMAQLLSAFWDLYDSSEINHHHGELKQVAELHEGIMMAIVKKDLDMATKLLNSQFTDARYRITVDLAKSDLSANL